MVPVEFLSLSTVTRGCLWWLDEGFTREFMLVSVTLTTVIQSMSKLSNKNLHCPLDRMESVPSQAVHWSVIDS